MNTTKLEAGAQFPTITLNTLDNGEMDLSKPEGDFDWKMVMVYRGKHCPLCTRYLNEVEKYKADFENLGIDIIAVSADNESQAKEHKAALDATFPIAYGLSIAQMQVLGLYLSNPRSAQETDHVFAEPGLFIINEKGQVQVLDISNGPFVRPELEVLISGLAFIRDPENHYPIRGTYQ